MNILGIGAHPDDLEIACGGALAKYAKQGHKVFMCHISNGNLGHVIIEPDELAEIREKESEKAAAVLGAEAIAVRGVGDALIEGAQMDVQKQIIEIIRYTKADVIISHHPTDYMRDHEQASQFAQSASFHATLPHLVTQSAYTTSFPPVYYMDTLAGIGFIPTEYVDITEEIDQKLEALACHESQIKWMAEHDKIDFLDFVRTCNKYRGLQASCAYAEGFKQYTAWPRFRTFRVLP